MVSNLFDYYNNLPQQTSPKSDFLRLIMSECGVSFTTAINWVNGKVKPSKKVYLEKLSQITGLSQEQLFV